MICPILANLYEIILEKKINIWLESHRKRANGQEKFRNYHSSVDHLVTLKIIVEECRNLIKPNSFGVLLILENLLT
jgi:hypothetical protein